MNFNREKNGTKGTPGKAVMSLAVILFFAMSSTFVLSKNEQDANVMVLDEQSETEVVSVAQEQYQATDTWIELAEDFSLSEKQLNIMLDGMEYFNDNFGVQPYIIFADSQSIEEEQDAFMYAQSRYDGLFDDGWHIVLVYSTDVLSSGKSCFDACYRGEEAATVFTDEFLDVLSANSEKEFNNADDFSKTVRDMFISTANAFISGETVIGNSDSEQIVIGERYVTKNALIIICAAIAVFFAAVILIAIWYAKRSNKNDARKESAFSKTNAKYDLPYSSDAFSEKKHSGGYYSYGNNTSQSYPVTCPKCRATAYLTEDGCCQYCSTKLK